MTPEIPEFHAIPAVECHVRIFVPGGGWITATVTDMPHRICAALSTAEAEISYTYHGTEYVEATDAYALRRDA